MLDASPAYEYILLIVNHFNTVLSKQYRLGCDFVELLILALLVIMGRKVFYGAHIPSTAIKSISFLYALSV